MRRKLDMLTFSEERSEEFAKSRYENFREEIKWLEENLPKEKDGDYSNRLHRFTTCVDYFGFMAFCGDIPEEYLEPTKELMSRGDKLVSKYYARNKSEATS